MMKIKFFMYSTIKILKGKSMDFKNIKKYKEEEQREYKEKIDQERSIPDKFILPKPDKAFIPPVDIRDYK